MKLLTPDNFSVAGKNGKQGGFTLVELLIVVAIIAIIAAIAMPQYTKYRLRSYKTELDSDLNSAYLAAEAYLTESPQATVDLAAALNSGYKQSVNVVWDSSDISVGAGNIKLHSSTLKNAHKFNQAMVTYDSIYYHVTAP